MPQRHLLDAPALLVLPVDLFIIEPPASHWAAAHSGLPRRHGFARAVAFVNDWPTSGIPLVEESVASREG
jgi:hypothetical protein